MAQEALAPALGLTEHLYSALSLAERASCLRQADKNWIGSKTDASRAAAVLIVGNRKSHSRPVISSKNGFAWTA